MSTTPIEVVVFESRNPNIQVLGPLGHKIRVVSIAKRTAVSIYCTSDMLP